MKHILSPHCLAQHVLLLLLSCLWITPSYATFRNWRDKKGNYIQAELVKKFGDKIILRDRNGKTYKLDPTKLSKEDQLYLNPPPPPKEKYSVGLSRSSVPLPDGEENFFTGTTLSTFDCEFSMWVKFLTADANQQGLKGVLLVIGEDEKQNYVIIDKAEGTFHKTAANTAELPPTGCRLTIEKDDEGNMVKGIKYWGFLVLLYSDNDELLRYQYSHRLLYDNKDKLLTLPIGARFTKTLEVVKEGAE